MRSCVRRARSAANVTRRNSSPPSSPTSASRRRCGTWRARCPGSSPPLIDYTGRPNVTALLRGTGGGRSLTFNGHIDVVPAGVAHRWSFDPWGAEVVDGRMYGRGAADMKAGVVAMLGAVARAAGRRAARDVCVETVIEEECTGNGAAACRARGPRTDAAIIPEPFNHAALEAQVGVLWATVTVEGKAAHAERADQADNAFLKALPVIEAIRALEAEVNAEERSRWFAAHPHPLNYNVGVVRAGDWASSVPEECVLEVRLAAHPGADLEAVKARFEAVVDARVEWRGFHAHGFGLERSRADLRRARPRAHGGARRPARVPGLHRHDRRPRLRRPRRDAGDVLRPIGGNLHAPDEWVDLESVKDTTLVLALAAAEWCCVARARRPQELAEQRASEGEELPGRSVVWLLASGRRARLLRRRGGCAGDTVDVAGLSENERTTTRLPRPGARTFVSLWVSALECVDPRPTRQLEQSMHDRDRGTASGYRACADQLTVHGTTTVTPSWANHPIDASSSPTSASAIVFATSSPGRSDPPAIARSIAVVVAHGHPVHAEHAQLVRDHARHRQRDDALVAQQQPDLGVAAAPAQAADRVHARLRDAERVDRHVRAAAGQLDGSPRRGPRTRRARRRARRARASFAASMSTATTRAPAAAAIITAARPTPPQPCTATHSPARTLRVDVQRGPGRHEAAARATRPRRRSAHRARRTRFRSARGSATYSRERAPRREARLEVAVADLRLAQPARLARRRSRSRTARSRASPTAHPRTAEPTSATTPHSSWPGTWGSAIDGSWPIQPCQSLRQTPVARIATTTPSGEQTGSGTVSIDSGCSKACITAARIALLSPPWTR